MRALSFLAALAVLAAGCAAGRQPDAAVSVATASGADGASVGDVWTGLDMAVATLAGRTPEACDQPFGTWFT